jgi:hypothetical protein
VTGSAISQSGLSVLFSIDFVLSVNYTEDSQFLGVKHRTLNPGQRSFERLMRKAGFELRAVQRDEGYVQTCTYVIPRFECLLL